MNSGPEQTAGSARVLVLGADDGLRRQLEAALRSAGAELEFRSLPEPAALTNRPDPPDCLLLNLGNVPPDRSLVLEELRRLLPLTPVLLVCDGEAAVTLGAARRAGAFDLLARPFAAEAVEPIVTRGAVFGALLRRTAELERDGVGERRGSLLLGGSAAIEGLRASVAAAAATEACVLVTGECGSGKERVARAVHAATACRDGRFVKLHCAAMPPGTMASELFGAERVGPGGATLVVPGCLEQAHGGSVLLDEVSELNLELQSRLADALRGGSWAAPGGTRSARLGARLFATTSCDLPERVRAGRFREDLLAALSGVTLPVPPLRERREDIPVLAASLLAEQADETRRSPLRLSPEAVARLLAHDWPGNVRELRNVLERAALLCSGAELRAEHVILDREVSARARAGTGGGGETLRERERAWILRVLRETDGNRSAAARRLGVSVRTIRNKLALYRGEGLQSVEDPPERARPAA
jgi:DNA-binding NtrC family response regulator